MQAKDIPDHDFLAAIDQALDLRDQSPYPSRGLGASQWDVAAVLAGHPDDVPPMKATQDYPEMPCKVVLAKAKSLIRRGLIDGCACGCRGDWERTTPDTL